MFDLRDPRYYSKTPNNKIEQFKTHLKLNKNSSILFFSCFVFILFLSLKNPLSRMDCGTDLQANGSIPCKSENFAGVSVLSGECSTPYHYRFFVEV
jgi:hypothetical protein